MQPHPLPIATRHRRPGRSPGGGCMRVTYASCYMFTLHMYMPKESFRSARAFSLSPPKYCRKHALYSRAAPNTVLHAHTYPYSYNSWL